MNYKDAALTQEQLAELKKSWRKTGWRLKALKPGGAKLPPDVDSEYLRLTKIDPVAANKHPYHTASGYYKKLIHDEKHNRTFILHQERIDAATNAVVSVINHDEEPGSADYIEKINKSTTTGWPVTWSSNHEPDMAYNADADELALTMAGYASATTYHAPGLIIISVKRKADKLKKNTCNQLADNDDATSGYFTCKSYRPPTTDANPLSGCFTKFVRYSAGRWWVWIECYFATSRNSRPYNLLGYFSSDGTWVLCSCVGDGISSSIKNIKGEDYNVSFLRPSLPSLDRPNGPAAIGTTVGYYGDPAYTLITVTGFEVTDEDIILTSHGGTGSVSLPISSYNFGMKSFIYRIDIEELIEYKMNPPIVYVAPGEGSVICGNIKVDAEVWEHPITQKHYWATPNYPDGFSAKTALSDECQAAIKAKVRGGLKAVLFEAHWGVWSGKTVLNDTWIENGFGAVSAEGTGESGPKTQAGQCFYDGEEINLAVKYSGRADEIKDGDLQPFLSFAYQFYPLVSGLKEVVGVQSTPALINTGDMQLPVKETTTVTSGGADLSFEVASAPYISPTYIKIERGIAYDKSKQRYILPCSDNSANEWQSGLGLWVYTGGKFSTLRRIRAATHDLAFDYVGQIQRNPAAPGAALIVSGNTDRTKVGVQLFDGIRIKPNWGDSDITLANGGALSRGGFIDFKRRSYGFISGGGNATGEIWLWEIDEKKTDAPSWNRDPRVWWDGGEPDAIIGAGSTHAADALGQPASFSNPRWSQSKGQSSCRFSFSVNGADYLPWTRGPFNENEDFPGSYDGTLQDMTRLVVERGVWDGDKWTWVSEGQAFIAQSPAEAGEGVACMEATAMGAIAMFATRSTYSGYHAPDIDIHVNAPLISDDGLTFYHEEEGARTTDWAARPEPAVFVDGAPSSAFSLDLASGEVKFDEDMTGRTATATFNSYAPGTNEAEDIIVCILTHPQELGGCGLDRSYITRELAGVPLERAGGAVWKFPKNNILRGDPRNRIRVNGAEQFAGTDFEWDYRSGEAIFNVALAEDSVVDGDCVYCTIQKSGATLRPISLKPKTHNSSYDAINEACRLVAPNYILREGRDGKLECDFFTQKPAGREDIVITDDDIIITSLESNPAYEGLATRVLSFGSGRLEELPDYCRGAEVEDVWPHGWHPGTGISAVTDGDPATGATGGYGKWGKPGEGLTLDVQNALIASEPDGTPALVVDMREAREPDTIVVARPSQVSTEGEVGGVVQILSLWASMDGEAFFKLVEPFHVPPGGNVHLKAGVNFDSGVQTRFLRVNIHSLGLYKWGRDKTHSQIGISEIQCYPDTTITGEARLQKDDPAAPLFDRWGLLDKYGVTTHVARGGAEDSALATQAQADLDARHTLEEIIRLVSRVSVSSPWLPGAPVFSTIRVVNSTLGIDKTFFVEDRSASADGDEYNGATLP